jgi:hypothetical protein
MYKEATLSLLSSFNICLLDIDLIMPLIIRTVFLFFGLNMVLIKLSSLQKLYYILEVHETVPIKYFISYKGSLLHLIA